MLEALLCWDIMIEAFLCWGASCFESLLVGSPRARKGPRELGEAARVGGRARKRDRGRVLEGSAAPRVRAQLPHCLEERVPCSTSRTWRRGARRAIFFSKDGRGVDQGARGEDLVDVSDVLRDVGRLEDRRGPRADDRRSR